ncbi:MAG: TIGR01777 family oxidoreductase [Mariniblastus sp.]
MGIAIAPRHEKRVVIAGGSGFLGQHLLHHFKALDYQVTVLTRSPRHPCDVAWDAETVGEWCGSLEKAEALINLTGRSVDCRYNPHNKAEILSSRINSTKVLHQAVQSCEVPPRIWLNSSTSTIYNDTRGNAPANQETSDNIGDDFSMNVAKQWEEEFFRTKLANTVQTALRIAIVMGKDGGAFPVMSKLAKFGLCSPQGSGDQWISWIHIEDFCRVVEFLVKSPTPGCVNVCSPNPIQNKEFNGLLKQQTGPWFTLPQPVWLLKIGAIFLRTQTELILKSRKVSPERLMIKGFDFSFPNAEKMISDLLK